MSADLNCADPVRVALIEAAAAVGAFLEAENAPPIWWGTYDRIHERAGTVWSDEATDPFDKLGDPGAYLCPSCREAVDRGPCQTAQAINALSSVRSSGVEPGDKK